jgi:hypothetical protein
VKRAIVAGSSIVGAAAFGYSLSVTGVAAVQQTITQIGWGFAAILVISGLREMARAVAWTRTFTGTDSLPVSDAFEARLAGEALGALIPMGFVIGEPTKAQHVADRMPFATAFGALMLEFAFYGASLALLLGAAIVAVQPTAAVLAVGVVAAVCIPAFTRIRHALDPVFRFTREHPRRAWTIAALEAAYHSLGIVEAFVILRFINPVGATWTAAVLFETVNRGVTIVFKMVPMRVGIDEATAALVANRLAIGSTTGVMLALVRKLRVLFWTALGLLVLAMRAFRRCSRLRTGSIAVF